ncbi:hypothetical protein [Brevundimonas sp.]|nr:hypothetical protein [Brevundimonas sp.]
MKPSAQCAKPSVVRPGSEQAFLARHELGHGIHYDEEASEKGHVWKTLKA